MSFTPELADVLKQAIEDRLVDLHTCLPARVVSYDPAKQRVSVVPVIKRKYEDGEVVTIPVIEDVPVQFAKGSKFSMTHPVAKDDYCQLIFTERSIEIWKRDGGIVDPRDTRKFHLTDCYALMGGQPETTVIADAAADKFRIVNNGTLLEMQEGGDVSFKNPKGLLEMKAGGLVTLKNDSGQMTIDASGNIEIKNGATTLKVTSDGKFIINGAKNLITILETFANAMTTAQVLTALGPQGFLPPTPTTLAQVIADLGSIKG